MISGYTTLIIGFEYILNYLVYSEIELNHYVGNVLTLINCVQSLKAY
jgi:general stress protein CsbA